MFYLIKIAQVAEAVVANFPYLEHGSEYDREKEEVSLILLPGL